MLITLVLIALILSPQQDQVLSREFSGFRLGDLYQDNGTVAYTQVRKYGGRTIDSPITEDGSRVTVYVRKNGRICAIQLEKAIKPTESINSYFEQFQSLYKNYFMYRDITKKDSGIESYGWIDGWTKILLSRQAECYMSGWDFYASVKITYININIEKSNLNDLPASMYPKLSVDAFKNYIVGRTRENELIFNKDHEIKEDKSFRYYILDQGNQGRSTLTFLKSGVLYQVRTEMPNVSRRIVSLALRHSTFKYPLWQKQFVQDVDCLAVIFNDGDRRFTEGYIGDQLKGTYLLQMTDISKSEQANYDESDLLYYKSAIQLYQISQENREYFDGLFAPQEVNFPDGMGNVRLISTFKIGDGWRYVSKAGGLDVYAYKSDYIYYVWVDENSNAIKLMRTFAGKEQKFINDLRHYLFDNYHDYLTSNIGYPSKGVMSFKAFYKQSGSETTLNLIWNEERKLATIRLASKAVGEQKPQ